MTQRWQFGASCLQCEGPLDHTAGGNPVDGGTRSSAVANCPHCRRYWLITTTISPFNEARPEEYYL